MTSPNPIHAIDESPSTWRWRCSEPVCIQWVLAISASLAALCLIVSGPAYAALALLAWAISIFALIVSISACVRAGRNRVAAGSSGAWRRRLGLLGATILMFGVQSAGCLRMARMSRECTISIVSSGNLRSFHCATEMYLEKYQCLPVDLNCLVSDDLVSEKSIVAPGDPVGSRTTPTHAKPSYVYFPRRFSKADSAVDAVFAYEREAWSIDDFRMFPTPVHAVIFADGHVEHLTPAQLDQALAR